LGLNHQSAPIELREQVAFLPNQTKAALRDLVDQKAVNEAVILSTCNRVELYTETQNQDQFTNWLIKTFHFNPFQTSNWYVYHDHQAVKHILRVASGLDSMVLGESQIFKQLKTAYHLACEAGSIGRSMQYLFQKVFAVTKEVRTETAIGASPISIGYVAVNLAKRIFSDLSKRSVLLIGAGEVIETTALHLYSQGVRRIIVANRSIEKAEHLARRFYGHWIKLSDVPVYLKEADIVMTATQSELPILGKGAVEQAIKARKHKPIFMVDLAVPRDIEPEVNQLEDIYLYNIDDLKSIVTDSRNSRTAAAQEAEIMIDIQASRLMRELQAQDANVAICDYRNKLEQLSEKELSKALNALKDGGDPEQILNFFCRNLTNKIMHTPTTQLRQAAFDGRLDVIALARQLLDI
jgi:glutamyl-tRNA reductase